MTVAGAKSATVLYIKIFQKMYLTKVIDFKIPEVLQLCVLGGINRYLQIGSVNIVSIWEVNL